MFERIERMAHLRGPALRSATLALVISALAGCTSLRDNYAYVFDTAEGCGITRYAKAWVETQVKEMRWTGGCSDTLASGNGTLTVRLIDGAVETYSGSMTLGTFNGEGTLNAADGTRRTGSFYSGLLSYGRLYAKDGFEDFNGLFNNQRFSKGTVYFRSGHRLEGAEIDETSPNIVPKTGDGIRVGALYARDGSFVSGWANGRNYTSLAEYSAAEKAYHEQQLAAAQREARRAEAEALRLQRIAEADAAEQRRRDQAETLDALNQLSNALGQAIEARGANRGTSSSTSGPCPPGKNLVNGSCRSGVAQ